MASTAQKAHVHQRTLSDHRALRHARRSWRCRNLLRRCSIDGGRAERRAAKAATNASPNSKKSSATSPANSKSTARARSGSLISKGNPIRNRAQFFNTILTCGVSREMRLPRMGYPNYVGTSRLHFSKRTMQAQGPTEADHRFGAMLSIKEYPPFSGPGMLDGLLQMNHEFILHAVLHARRQADRAGADLPAATPNTRLR